MERRHEAIPHLRAAGPARGSRRDDGLDFVYFGTGYYSRCTFAHIRTAARFHDGNSASLVRRAGGLVVRARAWILAKNWGYVPRRIRRYRCGRSDHFQPGQQLALDMMAFGFVGAIPAAICSWLSN